jgi:tetratricopeptide (TPR) repeat protein
MLLVGWAGGWFLMALLLSSPVHAIGQKDLKQRLSRAMSYLNGWRTPEAAKLVNPLLKKKIKSKHLWYVAGRLRYFEGRYKEALRWLKKALPKAYLKRHPLGSSVLATLRLTRGYRVVKSPHFLIHFPPGRDRILVSYAVDALEKAYHRLGKLYGYYPKERVRIQILENAQQLAEMSTLTSQDISRTGTIALCKYNRVLLTSPQALLRGYRWLDTLVHEYTHLVINRITSRIPIWLHEGLARYTETLWRRKTTDRLSPYSETILARAVKKDKLITFAQMHPSMAKLPSQEDAAQAYAQVFVLIQYFVQLKGETAIAQMLKWVAKGEKVPDAFSKVLGLPFKTFLQNWRAYLKKLPLKIHKGVTPEKKILKSMLGQRKRKKKQKKKDFWTRPSSAKEKGMRFLRLAEMLRERGRRKGALIEYNKAAKHLKNLNPSLQNKIALTHLQLRQYRDAIAPLEYSLQLYPNYVTTFYRMGRAYFGLKEYKRALKAFEQVNQINPFHPGVHRYLAVVYRKLKMPRKARRERRTSALLKR